MSDPLRLNLFALADRWQTTVEEVEAISFSELNEWAAYFRIQSDGGKRNPNPNRRR
jgi:hypothetical protein